MLQTALSGHSSLRSPPQRSFTKPAVRSYPMAAFQKLRV
jgi:hypothetical protein